MEIHGLRAETHRGKNIRQELLRAQRCFPEMARLLQKQATQSDADLFILSKMWKNLQAVASGENMAKTTE